MTPRAAVAIASAGALSWVVLGLLALLLFALSGCATARTPRGIAANFADRLDDLKRWPLSVQCQAVTDAQDACVRAGYSRDCA